MERHSAAAAAELQPAAAETEPLVLLSFADAETGEAGSVGGSRPAVSLDTNGRPAAACRQTAATAPAAAARVPTAAARAPAAAATDPAAHAKDLSAAADASRRDSSEAPNIHCLPAAPTAPLQTLNPTPQTLNPALALNSCFQRLSSAQQRSELSCGALELLPRSRRAVTYRAVTAP